MTATIKTLLDKATSRLAAVGPDARLEAEILLAHVLALSRGQLRTWPGRDVPDAALAIFERLLAARIIGQPVAYLTGAREFWSLPLKVTPDSLVPRSETELLVETALTRIPMEAVWRLADLGTGSGAIALALASERLLCHVTATDISPRTLNLARENAAHLGLGNVEFRCGDWLAALPPLRYHLLVSNPPYVRLGDPHLEEGDLRFEPRRALTSSVSGLEAIETLVSGAPARLLPGGWLLLEHGYDQSESVRRLLEVNGFVNVQSLSDLAGHERITLGQQPGAPAPSTTREDPP